MEKRTGRHSGDIKSLTYSYKPKKEYNYILSYILKKYLFVKVNVYIYFLKDINILYIIKYILGFILDDDSIFLWYNWPWSKA